jgi:agmatine deiminase
MSKYTLTAEWEQQSGVQLTWPHSGTDWRHMLTEVQSCFVKIAFHIAEREKVLIVVPHQETPRKYLEAGKVNMENVRFFECPTNDTWARDHGALSTCDEEGNTRLLHFRFNGWGLKYPADLDNQITTHLFEEDMLHGEHCNLTNFVLEGGSIDCDGQGTAITTAQCLLSVNRNEYMNREEIERYLCEVLGLKRILWLEHGYLEGDDTDGHVDTLARFCPNDTIAYVQCKDKNDSQYHDLKLMEEELQDFRTIDGKPYRLLPLPMPAPIRLDGYRLPATYANFLVINGAVLFPTYNQPDTDEETRLVLQQAFEGYDLIGIDCRALIKQHGSLHCVTMQYPNNVLI